MGNEVIEMKQLIVMLAMVSLGLVLAGLIAGDQENSIANIMKESWQHEIQFRSGTP